MNIKYLFNLKKHYSLKALHFLLFISFIPGITYGQPHPYKFNYLTVDEGLSHTDANNIAQDKEGYIWVATNFGLDRFDGYSIKKYYNNNTPITNAPKNRILAIYPDGTGNIWLGTENGLQCFDPRSEKYVDLNSETEKINPAFWRLFKPAGNLIYGLADHKIKLYLIKGNYIQDQKLKLPPGVLFFDMVADKNGVLYFASSTGLWTLDKNRIFKNIRISGLPGQDLSKLFFDNQNNLLMTAGNQVLLIRKNAGAKSLAANQNLIIDKRFICTDHKAIQDVVADNKLEYWVNTGTSLMRLDKDLNFLQLINNKNAQQGLNSDALTKVFIDRSQCLWVSSAGGGLNYCDLNQKLFYTIQHNPGNPNSLSGNHIRSVLADGEDLWIGTNANGLNLYNLKTQNFTFYNTYNSAIKLKSDQITALTLDNTHNLWIGGTSGIQILAPGRRSLWQPPGYVQFPTYMIETLTKDCYGNIWFGNHYKSGVIWKDASNYYHVKEYGEGYFILADKNKPQLFVSSRHGLRQILINEKGDITNTYNYKASLKPNSLSSSTTSPIIKQNDSTYWIGTMGGGLNSLSLQAKNDAYTIKAFAGNYGIFNDVEALEIDNAGNIWIGGNALERLNPFTHKLIRYDKSDGLQGNSFKVRASYKGADGRLYFGGVNGLNYFYPDEIKANTIDARPVLTDILINNQKPVYGSPDSSNAIQQAIGYDKNLEINYLQNNFVIFFSAMHFANPLKCKYRYKLTGFDKDWRYTDGNNPSASYNNLDYNSYKFIVEATNNDGVWSKSYAETTITITPPWWKSIFAKIIYFLLVISGLSGIYIYQARWYRLKREIEVRAVNEKKREEIHEQREEMHKQREDLYQQQLLFFTNISHEFRTPLSLILGPLESLINKNENSVLDKSYQLMLRNAKRLINMTSELMNFKKVSDSLIKLQVQPLLIDQFCTDLAFEFQTLANSKGIDFKITHQTKKGNTEPLTGLFDMRILEKILFNLLSNAFKYTDAGGKVSFGIFFDINKFKPSFSTGFKLINKNYRAKKYIYFHVADSGIGISGESITKIFDRYYRISKDHLGSGVGLALVKSLTELHKGDIYVYSERHQGTEIIIGVPWGEENYNEAEKATSGTELETQLETIDNSILAPLSLPDHEDEAPAVTPKTQKHILIVDDNQELRAFLKQTFEPYYYVYEAEDGNSAIKIVAEKLPDMIISDLTMPGMDGMELCKIIKENLKTRHIPFIILSAKDALATKIEGMESGADFYFSKPLSIDLLLLTINNIFEQGEKLKIRYTNNYLTEATELVQSERDKEFSQKLLTLIEDNIKDPDLDVDFLCKHLYTSRTKLYQQIKSVSDQSVGEFIRTIRLKKAIQIMTHENIAMNEVADRIGLQSSSNFSRTFKKEYGKSPLQFMQSLKNNGQADL